jgi:2-dehydro-3-deoxygalactonokinase
MSRDRSELFLWDVRHVNDTAIFVDLGTTNCRVWLASDDQVLARAQEQIGVRDSAKDGSNLRLRNALRAMIAAVSADANVKPNAVIASGMISSSLGLAEVPHVAAPAGLAELAAATRPHQFPDITPLPFLLVPGVRTGTLAGEVKDICQSDLMRGEETLCLGLMEKERINGRATVLNLGSHWKAIEMDNDRRIRRSITTLSGELIHAAQTTTILASAVPRERLSLLDEKWLDAGMRCQRGAGLPRALFCVRLLEQAKAGDSQTRLSFLVGAFISADLNLLLQQTFLSPEIPVLVVGRSVLPEAWRYALSRVLVPATVLSDSETEHALLLGLSHILRRVEIT